MLHPLRSSTDTPHLNRKSRLLKPEEPSIDHIYPTHSDISYPKHPSCRKRPPRHDHSPLAKHHSNPLRLHTPFLKPHHQQQRDISPESLNPALRKGKLRSWKPLPTPDSPLFHLPDPQGLDFYSDVPFLFERCVVGTDAPVRPGRPAP